MVNKEVVLVHSRFTPTEAREVLLSLIDSKINFHENRNFSMEERTGKRDAHSDKRIAELKAERIRVMEMIEIAMRENSTVRVESAIYISLESPQHP